MAEFLHGYSSIEVQSSYKAKIFADIRRLVYVLRGEWFTSNQIRDGFIAYGHVVPEEDNGLTVYWEKMVAGTLVDLTQEEKALFLAKRDVVIAEVLEKGFVSNARFSTPIIFQLQKQL